MPLSESDMEQLQIVAIRLLSSVADGGTGVAPPLQDGDLVTLEIEELFYNKDGIFPASKAAIAALPEVKITVAVAEEECGICLTEYVEGEEVKEMPCKHRYHSGCIGKWLGIRGSCPFCRYEMPVDRDGEDEQIMVVNVFIRRADQNDSDDGALDNNDSGADQNDSDDGDLDNDDLVADQNDSDDGDLDNDDLGADQNDSDDGDRDNDDLGADQNDSEDDGDLDNDDLETDLDQNDSDDGDRDNDDSRDLLDSEDMEMDDIGSSMEDVD